MSDTAIRVENLGKCYRIGRLADRTNGRGSMLNAATAPFRYLASTLRDPAPEETFWALKGVSFEVQRGEVVGLIGRNGAGKSTLLKVLSRITEPTEGVAIMNGRVASLLEVGTGFHPELTGRENIFLNGAILGMTKAEIDRKFDEIVDFSGVEKFIDTPVKRYSSGMRVRLAFSVAAHLEPEILLVDEVLAVGDAEFQKKCLGKMQDVAGEGRTVLFVSHNMRSIQSLCGRALLLEEGRINQDGSVEEVIGHYLERSDLRSYREWNIDNAPGDDVVKLVGVREKSQNDVIKDRFDVQESIVLEMDYVILSKDEYQLTPNFRLFDVAGAPLFITAEIPGTNASYYQQQSGRKYTSICIIPGNLLNEGHYSVTAVVSTIETQTPHFYLEDALLFEVIDMMKPGGSRHPSYSGKYPGAIRPLLNWATKLSA